MKPTRLVLRRTAAATAAVLLAAALALPALVTAAHPQGLRGWALLGGQAGSPVAFGLGWAGCALLVVALASQWRGSAGAHAALAGLLVAAFALAIEPRDWLAGAWLWAAALATAWAGSFRLVDPVAAAPSPATPEASLAAAGAAPAAPAPARRWRPGRRFWTWTIALWLAVALRDRAIDLFVPADEVRRTSAGPIEAIELLREGEADLAPMLDRAAAAGAGYREVVVGTRRYRAAIGADAYFVAEPAGPAPRWLVIERRSRPDGFWSRRLRRFATLRIVDRARGETVAIWRGPVMARGADTDAGQAAAFVRSVLAPGAAAPASGQPAPRGVALRAVVRIEPAEAAGPMPPRVGGCAPGVRIVDAARVRDPDRGAELVTGQWTYGLAGGIGSVFCDAAGVTVEHGRLPGEHVVDRLDPGGAAARRLVTADPAGVEPVDGTVESRLLAVRPTLAGLSLRKRQFAAQPPHRALRDVVIDFEPPAVERPPAAARKPAGRRRGAAPKR